MIVSLETVGTLHTHTHTHILFRNISQGIFASFLSLKNNLINKVNRVNFVYMFVVPLCT